MMLIDVTLVECAKAPYWCITQVYSNKEKIKIL